MNVYLTKGRLCLLILILAGFSKFAIPTYAQEPVQQQKDSMRLNFISNQPIGIAKGIYPGRVVWSRDPAVARWDGHTGNWWEERNIDQDILDRMYEKSVCALTGTTNPKEAWKRLFQYYNETNNREKKGYWKGELIAIKINLNNTYETNDQDNDIDQSPQATRSLLKQLTGPAGVSQEDIIIYDASIGWKKRAIPDRIYQPIHKEFPRVRWMSAVGSPGCEEAHWIDNAIIYTSPDVKLGNRLPKAVVESTYMINVALLKGHELSGITLCAKNHFGSIPFPVKEHDSKFVHQMIGEKGDYSAYVDLMGCPNLGKKTLLYIVDGIYGMQTNVGAPQPERDRWTKIFNGEWSASYFMSLDPVAIESVCLDFLFAEFGENLGFSGTPSFPKGANFNCDNYLKEAAKGYNLKYGSYSPNGVETGSLGVFEHWNNAMEKAYSRNLGSDQGIELYITE